jgi:hypothetical protein
MWTLIDAVVVAAADFALNPNPSTTMKRIISKVSLAKFRTNLGFLSGMVLFASCGDTQWRSSLLADPFV